MKPKETKELTGPKTDKKGESLQPGQDQPKVEITVEGVDLDPENEEIELERPQSN